MNIIDTYTFDEMLDSGKDLTGYEVEWHNGDLGVVKRLDNGMFVVAYKWVCNDCHKDIGEILLSTGLHNGALCYVVDKYGNYQANLRDEIIVCDECVKSRKAKVLAKKMLGK